MSAERPDLWPADLPPTRSLEEIEKDPELADRYLGLIYTADDISTRRVSHVVIIGATEPVTKEGASGELQPPGYLRKIPTDVFFHLYIHRVQSKEQPRMSIRGSAAARVKETGHI